MSRDPAESQGRSRRGFGARRRESIGTSCQIGCLLVISYHASQVVVTTLDAPLTTDSSNRLKVRRAAGFQENCNWSAVSSAPANGRRAVGLHGGGDCGESDLGSCVLGECTNKGHTSKEDVREAHDERYADAGKFGDFGRGIKRVFWSEQR